VGLEIIPPRDAASNGAATGPPWNLNRADLSKNSILFNLPDSSDSVRFLTGVAGGNRLYLRSSHGDPVMDYSLAGSRAAMGAMINCVAQL
jgi:hypothetical protein